MADSHKTLAVGVNLRKLSYAPYGSIFIATQAAHTVVVKGVHMYQNGSNVEYSDLDIMQMIGRAVRIY